MVVAIVILVILLAAGAMVLFTATRSSNVGGLSRETRRRDKAAAAEATAEGAPESTSTDLELSGRERADETRAQAGGAVAERQPAGVARWEPVDEEELGVTRRQFMNRGVLAAVGFAAATFGAGVLAFLWPTKSVGFGGKVPAGKLDDILSQINDTKAPYYVPLARTYIQPYPKEDLPKAEKVYPPAVIKEMENGIVALYQKCVHLGCRVPWCQSAQWFECPCHGSKYNRVGEKRDGPAPRGLDRWPATVDGGNVTIDTSGAPITGPPIGTDTTGQKAEGPHCI
jgi:cytochrome b6-f complex iron-sulfur subunit